MPSSVCLKSLDQTKENILLLSHGTMNYLLSFNGLNTQPSYRNVTIHNQSGSWFSPLFISLSSIPTWIPKRTSAYFLCLSVCNLTHFNFQTYRDLLMLGFQKNQLRSRLSGATVPTVLMKTFVPVTFSYQVWYKIWGSCVLLSE